MDKQYLLLCAGQGTTCPESQHLIGECLHASPKESAVGKFACLGTAAMLMYPTVETRRCGPGFVHAGSVRL